jgi:cation diffusion facilitator CzcD-associated flavoprotein CzcO
MSAFRVGILDGILNSHILPTIVSRATSARRNLCPCVDASLEPWTILEGPTAGQRRIAQSGPAMSCNPRVAIIGAGMSGICMAITLQHFGFDTFTIYEKSVAPGGTWRDNTYPGLTCDVPARFYQFTFAPNPQWSSFFSPGPEINEYFARTANEHGLLRHTRFCTEITHAEFRNGRWLLTTARGEQAEYDFVICGTGVLHYPRMPGIAGLDDFTGYSFHSARWNHEIDLSDKRVGVIGTGSTGVQIVTALAGQTAHLDLFQRTAQWVLPIPNFRYSRATKAAYRLLPPLSKLTYLGMRTVIEFLAHALTEPGWRRTAIALVCQASLYTVRDPQLREALAPDYRPMCKRLVVSSGFYQAIQRGSVHLVTTAIDHVEPRGVVTADGVMHELDVLVFATGFDAHAFMRPMHITGRDGITLDAAWAQGPKAFQTVAMPGFPNLFMLIGPHSPIANYSLTAIAEAQANYVVGWIRAWRDGEIRMVEPTQEATDRFNARIQEALPGTVWATGCSSWYLGKDGKPELWPWKPGKHRQMLQHPSRTDYRLSLPSQIV